VLTETERVVLSDVHALTEQARYDDLAARALALFASIILTQLAARQAPQAACSCPTTPRRWRRGRSPAR